MAFYPSMAFKVPRQKNGLVNHSNKSLKEFWNEVDAYWPISNGIGCYVFSIKTSGGSRPLPWYVGQTVKSFQKECFQHHKLTHYNNVLANIRQAGGRGIPILTFIPLYTNTKTWRLAKPTAKSGRIDYVEQLLIQTCLKKNPNLCNFKSTAQLRNIVIYGLQNTPPTKEKEIKEFKKLLGLS